MHEAKQVELQRLEDELRDCMQNPWDVTAYEIPEDKQKHAAKVRERIDHVSATREYPATFSIWTQLLISIVLPKAVQLFIGGI